jgi:hypothetical protein
VFGQPEEDNEEGLKALLKAWLKIPGDLVCWGCAAQLAQEDAH